MKFTLKGKSASENHSLQINSVSKNRNNEFILILPLPIIETNWEVLPPLYHFTTRKFVSAAF